MRAAWTRRQSAAVMAVHLASEAGLILVRDGGLALWDIGGEPVASLAWPGLLVSACSANGASFIGADTERVRGLRGGLTAGWERSLKARPTAVAVAPLGQMVAIADEAGGVRVLDYAGRDRWQATAARPIRRLAWVPQTGQLVAAADFGLVAVYGPTGEMVWRDAPLSNVGGMAVKGDGSRVIVACFTDGLRVYGTGPPASVLTDAGACRGVAASYDAEVVLTLGLDGRTLTRRDAVGRALAEWDAGTVAGFALDALGEVAVTAAGAELTLWGVKSETG